MRLNPNVSEERRNHHRGNVIDGERNARRRGNVGGIGDLLEVGLDGDGEREKHVIDNVQARRHVGVLHECVGGEDADQADVFQGERVAFANAPDPRADLLREEKVEQMVDQEQRRDIGRRIAELLHHQETGEDHENLPSRPR